MMHYHEKCFRQNLNGRNQRYEEIGIKKIQLFLRRRHENLQQTAIYFFLQRKKISNSLLN